MDKYTVDLDKVLNDFEYSELTGQQRPAAPKHSINTVLHSLNEYLNAGLPQHPSQPETTHHSLTPVNYQPETATITQPVERYTLEKVPEINTCPQQQQQPQTNNHHTPETVACQPPQQNQTTTIAVSETTEPIVNIETTEQPAEVQVQETVDSQPELTQETVEQPQVIETVVNQQDDEETDENLKQLIDEIDDYEQQMIETSQPTIKETSDEEIVIETTENHQVVIETTATQQPAVEPLAETVAADDVSETDTGAGEGEDIVECSVQETGECNNNDNSECDKQEGVDVERGEGGGDSKEEVSEERRGSIRPNSLQLSDEPAIDLIGEPGSTPYNNTWVDSSSPASVQDPSPPPGGLGTVAPAWTPDAAADACRRCSIRFTVLRRRHHCRACGELLCARCCGERAHLAYLGREARVCTHCLPQLHQSVATTVPAPQPPPPQSALKRQGTGRKSKSVTFVDGARPGSEPGEAWRWALDSATSSFLPAEGGLPPRATSRRPDLALAETQDGPQLIQEMKEETVTLALTANLLVHCRILLLECCMNTWSWCFSTEGLMSVGQDEIVILLELETDESCVPRDILSHILHVHSESSRGRSVSELGLSLHPHPAFLGSARHAGLLYLRPTFQCLQQLILPPQPYLVGVLVHRWETPWARLFPLRLLLRLGALYRYYPAPLLSSRARDSVYAELGHTVINLLADFRNYSYTLPAVQGLNIHIDAADSVTVLLPKNRYDQVTKALANSSEHIVALGAAFSRGADAHLVCLQDTHTGAYSTHAINIHNKPRKVTGASFIVLNGALKPATGLLAKSSVVEDGVMLQLQAAELARLRASLLAMRDHTVQSVAFVWTEDDVDFNQGATSPIDGLSLAGVPSVRVHGSRDVLSPSGRRCLRWTEVFLVGGSGEEVVGRCAEAVCGAAGAALQRYLDLLAAGAQLRVGLRATLGDAVGYHAGSNTQRLPPLYLASLDTHLVPVLHRLSTSSADTQQLQLELIFHILYT